MAIDAATGELRDATHYVRWLVCQWGLDIGLQGVRPIGYRELRTAKGQ